MLIEREERRRDQERRRGEEEISNEGYGTISHVPHDEIVLLGGDNHVGNDLDVDVVDEADKTVVEVVDDVGIDDVDDVDVDGEKSDDQNDFLSILLAP